MEILMRDDYFTYVSPKTMRFMDDFKKTAMVDYDIGGTETLSLKYASERYTNIMDHGDPGTAVKLAFGWMIVYFTSIEGKASIMNPWITAYGPFCVSAYF